MYILTKRIDLGDYYDEIAIAVSESIPNLKTEACDDLKRYDNFNELMLMEWHSPNKDQHQANVAFRNRNLEINDNYFIQTVKVV